MEEETGRMQNITQSPPMEIPNLLSIPQAAESIGVSRKMIYKYINNGRLQAVLVGGRKHLQRHEVEAMGDLRRQADVNATS